MLRADGCSRVSSHERDISTLRRVARMRQNRIALLAICALALGSPVRAVAAKKPAPPAAAGSCATAGPALAGSDLVLYIAADSVEIEDHSASASDGPGTRAAGHVIPDTPLSFPMVKGAAIVADVRVGSLTLRRDLSRREVSAKVRLDSGGLRIDPFVLTGSRGGSIGATLEVNPVSGHRYRIASRIQIRGMDGGALFALLGSQQVIEGARTDASINLSGQGATVRALAGMLNGDVRIVVGPARFAPVAINFGDAFVRVFETINPFRKTDKEIRLECAVLRSTIHDGVAVIDRGLGVETDKLDVIATGAVNLREETLDLAFHPRLQEGLGISIQATLADMVRVQGTLANPTIGIDPAGSARTTLNIGAAILTGGLRWSQPASTTVPSPPSPVRRRSGRYSRQAET